MDWMSTDIKRPRQMYHTPGMTDLSKMQADAIEKSKTDGDVMIHLHPYNDKVHGKIDGCPPMDVRDFGRQHEVYKNGAKIDG